MRARAMPSNTLGRVRKYIKHLKKLFYRLLMKAKEKLEGLDRGLIQPVIQVCLKIHRFLNFLSALCSYLLQPGQKTHSLDLTLNPSTPSLTIPELRIKLQITPY
jgi:hypothetical protein